MDNINEFINGEIYEVLLKNVQTISNIEIDDNVPFALLDYDNERLKAAQVKIDDLESLLNTNMKEASYFVEKKMQYNFDEDDEYPEGEEISDDDKPHTIDELPYYKNFLVSFLIEYYLLKEQPTELGKYLKRTHIAQATKYEKELCNIWKEVLELK
ncbi:hypothetical protein [Prevotella pallens]|jgi:hypothetical protein|uniref:Uncharacterized protein n=2 Tax=Prevotella pallens TaxID=60133 RepID=A0ABX9DPX4_9BACT|nr:hypothetical protein [Prevotella pallens]EGQ19134.1 hypothetical protein HMPREF9144_1030 [Prevotella pallens ATCC 700821]MBF1466478.1 hypothetical protein [Prevotella pallens]MBF1502988.1 hypothetical protein [Prevotella pallens]MBF1517547.1 hypothetical protein [Prevotella pallens]MBF1518557.1 hypothetical protein [Prevotella pallens]